MFHFEEKMHKGNDGSERKINQQKIEKSIKM